MKIVFDIDGVLCDEYHSDVNQRNPFTKRIAFVNKLFDDGHEIIVYTSRGMKSTNNDPIASDLKYREITEKQFACWGLKYHKLYFGKPNADMYVDNLNVLMSDFFND
jgi:ribonucleotide monophosphatase NagD (HAD superfamily)